MKTKAAGMLLCVALAMGASAATFTVSPSVVSNDYNGLITFQMTGLSPGETVQLAQYYDVNGNGVVDASDLGVRGDTVVDGQAQLLNGATNINVLRDEDGVANGTITASYRFALAPFGGNGVGSYFFRCSSPSNHFTPTNLAFTVVSAPYAQMVQGTVTNNSTNVSFAVVGLIKYVLGGNADFVVGGVADADGHYALKAPVGNYLAVAFQHGYVGNFLSFPPVALTQNATVTADIPLIGATTSISGSIIDSTNLAMHILPYGEVSFTTTNGFVTVTTCDSNGDFDVSVTPGVWNAGVLAQSASSQSYLLPDADIQDIYDTRSAPVTDAEIILKHATSLIYGRVQDNQGHPVAGANLFANADFGRYNSFATSDSNGLYSLAIDGGGGTISLQNATDPPFNNYIWPTPQFFITDGEALNVGVTGLVVTAHFRGQIVTDAGSPLSGFQLVSDSYEIYGAYSFATTDDNGYFDMPMFGGMWNVGYLNALPGLVFPDIPVITMTDGVNLSNTIVARTVTGNISGYVRDTGGNGVGSLTVAVTNHVGATNYTLKPFTDANGNYSVDVFDGTWNVSPDGNTLEFEGYPPVDATNVTVPPADGVADFIVSALPPPEILTTDLPDATLGYFYGTGLEVTNGAYPTLWYLLSGALPDGLDLDPFGYIYGTPTNLGLFMFTLKAQDPRGSNDVRVLSINVQPAPTGPLQISNLALPFGAVGCPYTNQLSATGGAPPYSWSLAAGSIPLPDGLSLDGNGLLAGIPTADSYAYPTFEVTDSLGAATNSELSVVINAALQAYSADLPPGEVGLSYYGYPPVTGGAEPQTWSVISNSLPSGLTLDPASGSISGTPDAAGIYGFTIEVSDGCAVLDLPLSITNYAAPQITTASLPVAALNVPYNGQLQVDGGVPPYYWFTSDWLGGLTLNIDGSITGTAYTGGTYTFLAQVYDTAGGYASRSIDLVAGSQLLLDMAGFSGPNQFTFRVNGVSGQSYTVQFSADLTNWADLMTTNAPADVFFFTDINATNESGFYQLRVNP